MTELAQNAAIETSDVTSYPAGDVTRAAVTSPRESRKRRPLSRSSSGVTTLTVPLSTTPDPEIEAIQAAMLELAKL